MIRSLLLRGGMVCDGTGAEPYPADVLVMEGRIAEVRPGIAAGEAEVLVVGGRIVAPGFIDLHSHADLILPLPAPERDRLLAGRILQGITTEVVGNCGLGPAPSTTASAPVLAGILSWMTPPGCSHAWPSVGAWLEEIESSRPPLNVATLLPHGSLRLAAMGLRPGPPSPGEQAVMARAAEAAFEEGAFGISTGLIYAPGMFSDTAELIGLGRIAARHRALFTSHIRGASELLLPAVEELLQVGRVAGCAVHHSHSEAVGRAHWNKIEAVFEAEESARRDGVAVTFDMFPYTTAATMMIAIYPPWSLEGGVPALLARLRDPADRNRIRRDIATVRPSWPPWNEGGWPHNLVSAVGWEGIAISRVGSARNRAAQGLSLARLGEERSLAPFDAISDLLVEEEGDVGMWVFEISGDEFNDEALRRIASHPSGAFCTDAVDSGRGLPHPAAFGAFPRVLSRWVRQTPLLTLGEAIRRMTGWPATILGLRDRGCVRAGFHADLVVFDPATVADRATFTDPRRPPEGIDHVFVNGSAVVRSGAYEGGSAGRVLRKPALPA